MGIRQISIVGRPLRTRSGDSGQFIIPKHCRTDIPKGSVLDGTNIRNKDPDRCKKNDNSTWNADQRTAKAEDLEDGTWRKNPGSGNWQEEQCGVVQVSAGSTL